MLYILALHIIFVITWFAGLFYIVRLFVYHSEANELVEPERSVLINHFKGAQRRLWYGITWPSMIGTYIFGFWLLNILYGTEIPGWMMLKLAFVVALTIYHMLCGRFYRFYQKDIVKFSSLQMRLWNELATVFLVAIIFIVSLKDLSNWLWLFLGILIFSMALFSAVLVYRNYRKR